MGLSRQPQRRGTTHLSPARSDRPRTGSSAHPYGPRSRLRVTGGPVTWSLVIGIGLAVGVGLLAYIELRRHLFEQCAVRLRAQARPVIDRRMEHLLGQIQLPELAAILAMDLTNRDTTAILVDPSGEVVAAGPPHEGPVPPVLLPGQYRATFDGDPEVTYIIRRPRTSRLLVALIPPRVWLSHPPAIVQLT